MLIESPTYWARSPRRLGRVRLVPVPTAWRPDLHVDSRSPRPEPERSTPSRRPPGLGRAGPRRRFGVLDRSAGTVRLIETTGPATGHRHAAATTRRSRRRRARRVHPLAHQERVARRTRGGDHRPRTGQGAHSRRARDPHAVRQCGPATRRARRGHSAGVAYPRPRPPPAVGSATGSAPRRARRPRSRRTHPRRSGRRTQRVGSAPRHHRSHRRRQGVRGARRPGRCRRRVVPDRADRPLPAPSTTPAPIRPPSPLQPGSSPRPSPPLALETFGSADEPPTLEDIDHSSTPDHASARRVAPMRGRRARCRAQHPSPATSVALHQLRAEANCEGAACDDRRTEPRRDPGAVGGAGRVLTAMHRPMPDIYAGELLTVVDEVWERLPGLVRTATARPFLTIGNGHAAWRWRCRTRSAGDKVVVLGARPLRHGVGRDGPLRRSRRRVDRRRTGHGDRPGGCRGGWPPTPGARSRR